MDPSGSMYKEKKKKILVGPYRRENLANKKYETKLCYLKSGCLALRCK